MPNYNFSIEKTVTDCGCVSEYTKGIGYITANSREEAIKKIKNRNYGENYTETYSELTKINHIDEV